MGRLRVYGASVCSAAGNSLEQRRLWQGCRHQVLSSCRNRWHSSHDGETTALATQSTASLTLLVIDSCLSGGLRWVYSNWPIIIWSRDCPALVQPELGGVIEKCTPGSNYGSEKEMVIILYWCWQIFPNYAGLLPLEQRTRRTIIPVVL